MLELKSVSKAFGMIVVASDIDLSLARGEALGIIGPNGAGKSTLFNLVTGMLRPDRGRVLLEGRDITALPPEQRCRAGLGRSFQIPLPFEHLSVFENLSVAALFGGGMSQAEAVQVCGETLALTGLEAKANLRAGSLSLLDRKRLELARALATRPRILLLDEIAGGLTDAECHILIDTIRSIHARGISIIWIEHVVHALLAVADRLLVINFGKRLARRLLPRGLFKMAGRAEEYARGMAMGGTLFEEMGFYYVGPIDGHNLDHLVPVLENVLRWDSARIRRLFGSYGLTLLEWEKRRTDMLTIQESGIALVSTQPQ